jgi:hypothetical protein
MLPLLDLIRTLLTILLENVASDQLNYVHDIGCIREVVHSILHACDQIIPNKLADREGAAPGSILD